VGEREEEVAESAAGERRRHFVGAVLLGRAL
jgi:hypothetical protein